MTSSGTGNNVVGPPAREELPPIVKAAQSINQTLQLDESYPDLDSYCRGERTVPALWAVRTWTNLPLLFSGSIIRVRYSVRRRCVGPLPKG